MRKRSVGLSDDKPYVRQSITKTQGFCILCGRRLKSEESKIRGYGETCYKKALRHKRLF